MSAMGCEVYCEEEEDDKEEELEEYGGSDSSKSFPRARPTRPGSIGSLDVPVAVPLVPRPRPMRAEKGSPVLNVPVCVK